jgi:hypothetical protein
MGRRSRWQARPGIRVGLSRRWSVLIARNCRAARVSEFGVLALESEPVGSL